MKIGQHTQYLLQLVIIFILILVVNVIGNYVYAKWDLTEEKRYTLTPQTVEMLGEIEDVIYVKVLLDGDFPAGFKRLQSGVREMLEEFRDHAPTIEYQFENPNAGSVQTINQTREELAKDGIMPTTLRIRESAEASEQLIYPYALFYYGNAMIPVNLLENEQPGLDSETILNNALSLLEYKFADAIYKIRQYRKKNIVFTSGHGELTIAQTASLESELRKFYNTSRVDIDTIILIPPEIDLVIVAKPTKPFEDKHLFILDQYLMSGGSLLFLIDPLDVALDSLNRAGNYIPGPYDLNLDPLLFKAGVRIQPNLVLDLECTRIPLVVGQVGGRPQTELFPWYYHPLVAPVSGHPIINNLDRINLQFPASIDTLRTRTAIRKTRLLQSSAYARIQRTPVRLNFEILRFEPDPDKFNNGPYAFAYLLEGDFESLFKNRVSDAFLNTLARIGAAFRQESEVPARMIVVSDGDLAKNLVNLNTGDASPLGYNKFENYVFEGNKNFMLNAIEYLMDEKGLITARSKEVKLRLLDTVKAQSESLKWQLINIGIPVLVLLLTGGLYQYFRRRKYAKA